MKRLKTWKHRKEVRCMCCGEVFIMRKSAAKGRKFKNDEHRKRWYGVRDGKGRLWSEMEVKEKIIKSHTKYSEKGQII